MMTVHPPGERALLEAPWLRWLPWLVPAMAIAHRLLRTAHARARELARALAAARAALASAEAAWSRRQELRVVGAGAPAPRAREAQVIALRPTDLQVDLLRGDLNRLLDKLAGAVGEEREAARRDCERAWARFQEVTSRGPR